jgi:hypothetical protein
MHDRRSSTSVASPDNDPKRAAAPGPGKSTLTGQLSAHTAKAVKGGDDNVDIDHLNKDHAGMDTARLGQSAELAALEHKRKHAHSAHEKHALDKQIKQIKHDHLGYQTLKASKYYDQEGRELGDIPAHTAVLINAGTVTKIKLNPNTNTSTQVAGPDASAGGVECAFVFETVDPADPHATRKSAGGWIPTSVLPPAARKEDRSIASKISKARDDKHDKFEAQPIPILTSAGVAANPPDLTGKFTYPKGKQVSKLGKPENQGQDYLYNLSVNVPLSGGKRFGVETTRLDRDADTGANDEGQHPTHPLDGYHEFYPEAPRKEVPIDLYDKDGTVPSGKMWFVYGYVRTSADAKIYGWINKKMLAQ